MVKTYSLKADGNTKLSTNFIVREFACKDGSDKILIDMNLVALLQKIHDEFGKPITITSAYRNDAYNIKIGGASNSQHIYGTAVDMTISGVTPLKIAQYTEYLQPKTGGIGVYSSWTHVDVRASRSRWDNRSGKEVVVSGYPGWVETPNNNLNEEELTMTQYEELKGRIEKLEPKYGWIDENLPDWAKPTIQKLVDKGILKGDDTGNLRLTEDMLRMLVILDRAGAFEK